MPEQEDILKEFEELNDVYIVTWFTERAIVFGISVICMETSYLYHTRGTPAAAQPVIDFIVHWLN